MAASSASSDTGNLTPEQWREDIAQLLGLRESVHLNLYHTSSKPSSNISPGTNENPAHSRHPNRFKLRQNRSDLPRILILYPRKSFVFNAKSLAHELPIER